MRRITILCLLFITGTLTCSLVTSHLSGQELIIPLEAQVGQPVLAQVVCEDEYTVDYFPKHENDTYVVLFDAGGKPVIMFWSPIPGMRNFVLAVNTDGPPALLTKPLQYGTGPPPPPIVIPIPTAERVLTISAPDADVDLSPLDPFEPDPALAAFYYDFAGVVSRDEVNGLIESKQQFRDAYTKAGKLCFAETGSGSPELAEAIDKTIQIALGLDRGEFDHRDAKEILLDVAWFFNGGK